MNLVCEKCDTAMRTVFYEGVAIQLCMSCKGAFLSQKKLEIIENNCEIEFHDASPSFIDDYAQVNRHCPKCKIEMKKMRYGHMREAKIDFCTDCHGLWLDKTSLCLMRFNYEIAERTPLFHQHYRP